MIDEMMFSSNGEEGQAKKAVFVSTGKVGCSPENVKKEHI